MTLVLSVLRCPDSVPPATREVGGGEFSIGRGPDNDWVLPDPDRHLSKRHCVLAFRAGGWQIADLSSNGTFLNRDAAPIGQGKVRELQDGDRLHVGAYEIEIRVTEAGQASGFGHAGPAAGGQADAFADPFGDDPFRKVPDPFAEAPPLERIGVPDPVLLPHDFDPLAPDPSDAFGAPTQPDHSPSLQDAFRAPQPAPALLPDDWDLDTGPGNRPPPLAAPPPPPPPAPPVGLPPDDDWTLEPPPAPPAPAPIPAAPITATPAEADPTAADPWGEDPVPSIPAAHAVPPPAPPPAQDGDLAAAFLRGAGLPDAALRDPAATMEELGRAFRVLVAGLRRVLIARAEIKGEFRIEQTMIRSSGNNPLKFSADDDDAVSALLGTGRRVDMRPSGAIADALRDMRLHEIATVAAMQSAVRALLAQLDPAALRDAGQGGLALVPAQRKARAWDAYEKLHARIVQALADDFDSVFGKAFARAYEDAMRETAANKDEP